MTPFAMPQFDVPFPAEIADILRQVADHVSTSPEFDPSMADNKILPAAQMLMPGWQWASITAQQRGQTLTTAATDPTALQVDKIQYQLCAGPCLTALSADPVLIEDLSADTRWPAFASDVAAQTPVRAVLSQPVRAPGLAPASVNFYAAEPRSPKDARAGDLAAALVMLARVASAQRHRAEHLNRAMLSREPIAAAVGILMHARRLTYEQGFALLVEVSQRTHRKLRDLADDVLFTGTLTGRPEQRLASRSTSA